MERKIFAKKSSRFYLFCSVCLVFLVVVQTAYGLTASMGNARMILRPEVKEGEITTINKEIQVNNVNEFPVKITLTPSEEIEDIITIFDKEFVLQNGETKFAKFQINLEYGGEYDGKIFVTFAPEDSTIKQSPVGLSSRIIILAEGPENPNQPIDDSNETVDFPDDDLANITPDDDISIPDDDIVDTTPDITNQTSTSGIDQSKKSPDPIIGLIIIVAILITGIIVFFMFRRRIK